MKLEHSKELTLAQVRQISPEAARKAGDYDLKSFYVLEPNDPDHPSIVVDGTPWDLMGIEGLIVDAEKEDFPPYAWFPEDNVWADASRF